MSGSAPAGGAPLFTSPGDPATAQTSAIVTTPIDPPGHSRASRLRWLVAGLATVLVFAVVGGVIFLAVPRAGQASATAHYAPANTQTYAEVRIDLPGDQRENLASFMSHFPGFADQAAFQQKIDESLDSLLKNVSNEAIDWNNDVKPWFGGQLAVFGNMATPSLMTTSTEDLTAAQPKIVIVLTVSDTAKLQSVIDANVGGAQVSSVDYRGQQIKTIAQPGGTSQAASYVITDDALLVAPDADQLKQALDVKAGTSAGLADDTFFTQQLAALHADRLATIYYDASQTLAQLPQPSALGLSAECLQLTQAAGNIKYVGEVRAEADHLAFSMRAPIPSGDNLPPPAQNKQTTLAQSMPADTLVYFESRNAGDNLGWLIKNLLSCSQSAGGPLPSGGLGDLGDATQMFEQFLGAKPEDYLDFLDDVAVGVTYTNDKVGAGIVGTVDDEAVASSRVDKLVSLLKLFGSGLGGGQSSTMISTSDADHNGVKVTTVTITPSGGGMAQLPGSAPVTLQLAVANGKLYLGIDDFVTGALDRQSSDSLASSAHYQKAISATPAQNAGVVYVDVGAVLDAYEEQVPADDKQDFDTNTKPFLDPLSTFSMVSHVDGGMYVTDGFLFVE